MSLEKILIVDDDFSIRQFLRIGLEAHNYATEEAGDAARALELAPLIRPVAVLLDLGLPDLDGCEVIQRLRSWTWTPIIVMSVRDGDDVVVKALDLGADDYLTKPFQLNVLLARLRAALRRREPQALEEILHCGSIAVDQGRRLVTVGGTKVALTPNEYALLVCLMVRKERLVAHRDLLGEVWGKEFVSDTQLLRVHISNLRKKLERGEGPLTATIENEPGLGYRLVEL